MSLYKWPTNRLPLKPGSGALSEGKGGVHKRRAGPPVPPHAGPAHPLPLPRISGRVEDSWEVEADTTSGKLLTPPNTRLPSRPSQPECRSLLFSHVLRTPKSLPSFPEVCLSEKAGHAAGLPWALTQRSDHVTSAGGSGLAGSTASGLRLTARMPPPWVSFTGMTTVPTPRGPGLIVRSV